MAESIESALALLQKSFKVEGFKGELDHRIAIVFDHDPIRWSDIYDSHESYLNAVQKIPGVECDAGQGEGYAFEIDASEYTHKSEMRLMKLIDRTRRYEDAKKAKGI
jgi:hypothetical protein